MEILADLVKILLPAAIVLYGMYLSVKSFLRKDYNSKLIEIKAKNVDALIPVRLQAYERMALFLERISPGNLVLRLNDPGFNVGQFHELLLAEIRQEYNYNLSQQIYMGNEVWHIIQSATEQVTATINNAAEGLDKEAPSVHLAKRIVEFALESGDMTQSALIALKEEVRSLF